MLYSPRSLSGATRIADRMMLRDRPADFPHNLIRRRPRLGLLVHVRFCQESR